MRDSPVGHIQTVPQEEQSLGQRVAVFVFKYILGAVMDEKAQSVWTVSLGRIMVVALTVQAMIGWARGYDIATGQQHILLAAMSYAFGSKLVSYATETVATLKKPRTARTRVGDGAPSAENGDAAKPAA